MSNSYSETSFAVNNLNEKEIAWVKAVAIHIDDKIDDKFIEGLVSIGFDNSGDIYSLENFIIPGFCFTVNDNNQLWITDNEGAFNEHNAAVFLMTFLKNFRPKEIVSFEWSVRCDKPVLDEFFGGACAVSANNYKISSTDSLKFSLIEKLQNNDGNKVIIDWVGGLVRDVNAPKNITVIIRDYDTEGADEEELSKDDNGKLYYESVWSY